jgi:hypothetical protein
MMLLQADAGEFLTKRKLLKKLAPPVESVLKHLDLEMLLGAVLY